MISSKVVSHVRNNAIAWVALFVALTGTAFAAGALQKNSVGTKQLKKNAVTAAKIKKNAVNGAKVKDDSLTGKDIKESTLGIVPDANHANSADSAQSAQSAANAQNADKWDGIDSAVLGRTMIYSGVNFDPRDTLGGTTIAYIGTGSIRCNGAPEEFTTHLELPQGASITSVDFRYVDNDGVANPSANITAYDSLGLHSTLSDSLVTVSATGADSDRRTTTVILATPEVIDNNSWDYQVNWNPVNCASTSQLVGVGVHYTLPTS